MPYSSAQAWHDAPKKNLLFFGMSGLGKTTLCNLLRASGTWFHYSVDYRIGTRYLGEHIADSFKREAIKTPYLRELLMSDSIYIASNITFDNLAPLSKFMGKPGNPAKGGLSFQEYQRRQNLHRAAEQAALLDTVHFMHRARDIYGYDNFVCDSGGSICEVVDPWDKSDPIMKALSQHCLMVWIEGDEQHRDELIKRHIAAPKPMYYQPDFLETSWTQYLETYGFSETEVNPDDFMRWVYGKALAQRQPRYAQMAQWGVTVQADEVMQVRDAQDVDIMIAAALGRTSRK